MIKTINFDNCFTTPKNYSRKGVICTCMCSVEVDSVRTEVNSIKVVYSVNPTGGNSKPPVSKNGKWKQYWNNNYCYWGTFNEIVELPYIFSKMKNEDYTIITSYFKRDHVLVPFIVKIVINNLIEYNILKLQIDSKNKLGKIQNQSNYE